MRFASGSRACHSTLRFVLLLATVLSGVFVAQPGPHAQGLPDLQWGIMSIHWRDGCHRVQVSAVVANAGDAPANDFGVQVFWNGRSIGISRIRTLGAGDVVATPYFRSTWRKGRNIAGMSIDPQNRVVESNEDNNITFGLPVGCQPGLPRARS